MSTTTATSTSFENAFRGYDYVTPAGVVRTAIDDAAHHLYRFTPAYVLVWSATFSLSTPDAIVSDALGAALADMDRIAL